MSIYPSESFSTSPMLHLESNTNEPCMNKDIFEDPMHGSRAEMNAIRSQ